MERLTAIFEVHNIAQIINFLAGDTTSRAIVARRRCCALPQRDNDIEAVDSLRA